MKMKSKEAEIRDILEDATAGATWWATAPATAKLTWGGTAHVTWIPTSDATTTTATREFVDNL
jgi:hypothetical protein